MQREYVVIGKHAAFTNFTKQVLTAQLCLQWCNISLAKVFAQFADFLDLKNVDAQYLDCTHHLNTNNG